MSEAKPWILLTLGVVVFLSAIWIYDRVAGASHDVRETLTTPPQRLGVEPFQEGPLLFSRCSTRALSMLSAPQNDAESEDADPGGGSDDTVQPLASYESDLLEALERSPVDPTEIRRLLTAAACEGHDEQALYQETLRRFVGARPYLVPTIPPWARVAPLA